MMMRKMDEMELSISLKAIKAAWLYAVIFLFVWVVYDFVQTRTFGLPFILLISQNLVFFAAQEILKWKTN